MLQTALDFLRKHNEITFATTDGTSPRLRIFRLCVRRAPRSISPPQPRKPFGTNCKPIPTWNCWPLPIISLSAVQVWLASMSATM